MKFVYKKIDPKTIRPIIPVELLVGTQSVRHEVLVDSGADLCLFDAEIAEVLGLTVTDGEKHEVGGITGQKAFYYLHPVTLNVGGNYFAIEAGFYPNMPNYGHGVVGQKGFFENLVVKFDYSKEEVELRVK